MIENNNYNTNNCRQIMKKQASRKKMLSMSVKKGSIIYVHKVHQKRLF